MSLFSRRSLAAAAAVGVGIATITGLGAIPANAGTPPVHVISDAYVGPLQFAVAGHSIFVADSAQSALFKVGRAKAIAYGPATNPNPQISGDLAGVAVADGSIAYTTSTGDHSDTRLTILHDGHKKVVSLSAFERKYNPDKRNHYGVLDADALSKQCTAELNAGQVPISYKGQYDSHPYAVASLGHGSWAVADAGGNDILKVDPWGHVSVIAVLPVQPLKITTAIATALQVPDCAGITYRFEPVPTDVEVGPHGKLYVTTLAGGPEGVPALGARSSVYQVGWGWTHRIATGFNAATNLAISPSGCIYVAELGAGQISIVRNGGPKPFAPLFGVVGVEWANGHLYASTAPAVLTGSGAGTIVRFG
ncbi:MAG TPA: ScyD/ScyE family protein [Amnibacterium sp.]|jgi:hypothetical protein|uniref:ScyD/ScyE family protein n=1 Tax=Amnibacterium sp. TaxID=1872496 RepID=UPI002F94F42F